MSFLTRLARQWIAGEILDDAIGRTKKANESGLSVIINHLGEHVKDKTEADDAVKENLRILDSIEKSKLNACISIKPTHIGLYIEKNLFLSNAKTIISKANEKNIFVWIDMEDSEYTEVTIDVYLELFKIYSNIGIAIQANLKRSENDVKKIAAQKGIIRLVKGAYKENSEIAFMNRHEVTVNFSKLMGYLFYKTPYLAIATHDDKLIDEAIEANKTHKKNLEIQTLMGVRNELKNELVKKGFRVVDYIPYGKNWLPYSIRRIKERKRNIFLILRSIFDF